MVRLSGGKNYLDSPPFWEYKAMQERKVATFNLLSPGECDRYSKIVNADNVTIMCVTDGLTKEGDVVRAVDYREKTKKEIYTPPIS
jgi:hypothetical protein